MDELWARSCLGNAILSWAGWVLCSEVAGAVRQAVDGIEIDDVIYIIIKVTYIHINI